MESMQKWPGQVREPSNFFTRCSHTRWARAWPASVIGTTSKGRWSGKFRKTVYAPFRTFSCSAFTRCVFAVPKIATEKGEVWWRGAEHDKQLEKETRSRRSTHWRSVHVYVDVGFDHYIPDDIDATNKTSRPAVAWDKWSKSESWSSKSDETELLETHREIAINMVLGGTRIVRRNESQKGSSSVMFYFSNNKAFPSLV